MTPQEAVQILFTDAERLAEAELKVLGQKELPILINRLTLAETAHPGFLGIKKALDKSLIDVCQIALDWCNG